MGPNGEFYCVAITDRSKAQSFITNNNRGDVVANSGDYRNMFPPESDFYTDFELAFEEFNALGKNDAWCHAMSDVAEKHVMGITIMKAESDRQFKSKHVKRDSDGKYVPAECA